MTSDEIVSVVARTASLTGQPVSVQDMALMGLGAIRTAVLDKALDDAVQDGKLLRKRIDGVMCYMPAAPATAGKTAAAAEVGPAAAMATAPKASKPSRARPVPLPKLDVSTLGQVLLKPKVELRNPAERVGRRWDYLLDHLDRSGAPTRVDGNLLMPTLEIPARYGKALQAFVRQANKDRAPRQYRIATGLTRCVLQRTA